MGRMKRRTAAIVLCITMLAGSLLPVRAKGASLTLTLEQAKALAYASSSDYRKINGEIALKLAEYTQAVKSGTAKRIDMATFRWSPLLSFKFPQQPDLAQAYEWQYKPMQIQTNIRALRHELSDVKYKLSEEISNLYVKIYTAQEKITFNRQRLEETESTLARNEAKLMAGEGKQADIDKMKKEYVKLSNDQSLMEKEFDTGTKELSDYVKIDVSLGYTFTSPFITAELDRSILPDLTDYTLEWDQGFFETKLNTYMGKTSIELNELLMRQKYGSNMNIISPYINQAKEGGDLDPDSFKASYDWFLDRIDAPWNGSFRILFIKISKSWLKGSNDGIRYVQDEPYALYTAALEYQNLLLDEENAGKALKKQISDGFENLVTAKNVYTDLLKTQAEAEKEADKSLALNKAGKISYDEYRMDRDRADEGYIDTLDALETYSELLYSYDRLTCGGLISYLTGGTVGETGASGGTSIKDEEDGDGNRGKYRIESIFEDQMFEFSVSLQGDDSPDADKYELWIDGIQIGNRTEISEPVRHLTLTMEQISTASVRFYKGDEMTAEYTFDPWVTEGDF